MGKLNWDDIEAIRKARREGERVGEIAQRHGVSPKTVSNIVNEKTWKGKRPRLLKGRKTGRRPGNATVVNSGKKWEQEKRKAKQSGKKAGRLSIKDYNSCYKAYQIKQSAAYVADQVGISEKTAKRYIEKGDPSRNLRPLKDRFDGVMARVQEDEDYSIVVARREMQMISRALLAKFAKSIRELDPAKIKPFMLTRGLKDLQVILERCLGVADATVDVQIKSRFDGWSYDELMTFVETGTVPEHDVAPAARGGHGKA